MQIIDSHAHLNAIEFKASWQQIVQEAQDAGVTTIINNAGDLSSSQWGIEQSKLAPQVYATVGIHPEFFLESDQPVTIIAYNNLRRLAKNNPKVVAIGEIGLDYTLDLSRASIAKQHELLTGQLELALDLDLPVTLHVRDLPGRTQCFNDLMQIIRQFTTSSKQSQGPNPQITGVSLRSESFISNPTSAIQASALGLTGVFHCWTGTPDQLQQALQLGFYISFSGILTYKSAGHILEAAKLAPLDRILIETDAPYLTPEPARSAHRPSVNQPKYVIMTAEKLASIKGESLQTIAEATAQNTRRLFRLPSQT